MYFIKLFFSTLGFFLLIDLTWLGFVAKNLYAEGYGSMMRHAADGSVAIIWPVAILVYALLTLGVVLFVVKNAQQNWLLGLGWGALFGLITYGVYDGTCYSVFANWPLKISIIDTIWGMFLCGVVGAFSTYISKVV